MKSKLLVFICLLIVIVPGLVFGAEPVIVPTTQAPFIPLVGIPGIPNPSTLQFGDYINSLYRLAISIAALLAVFKIVIAGAKYMLDDVVTHKQEAKDEIRGALVGLLIILGAVLILNTVNTDITKNMIAIDVLDTSSSSTIAALLAEIEKANAEARNACILAGPNCVTITCGIFDGWMEPQNNETDIDACNRTCQDVFKGKFVGHQIGDVTIGGYTPSIETGWQTATCSYDKTVAARCDINGSKACCEYINKNTWYSEAQVCASPASPVRYIDCGTALLADLTCTEAKKECTDSGDTVIGQPEMFPSSVFTSSVKILCTDKQQGTIGQAAQDTINNSTFNSSFVPIPGVDIEDQLTQLSNLLDVEIVNATDILGINNIPYDTLVTAGDSDSEDFDMIAGALQDKCSKIGGTQVVYASGFVDNGAGNAQTTMQFYCLK